MALGLIRTMTYNTTIHTMLYSNLKATLGTHNTLKTWTHTAEMQTGKNQITGYQKNQNIRA